MIKVGFGQGECAFPALSVSLTVFSFALHLLDRMARGLRIFYYHYIRRVDDTDDNPTGLVTVLSDDTIRVSVRTKQSLSLHLTEFEC